MAIYGERGVFFLIVVTGEMNFKFGGLRFFYQVFHI